MNFGGIYDEQYLPTGTQPVPESIGGIRSTHNIWLIYLISLKTLTKSECIYIDINRYISISLVFDGTYILSKTPSTSWLEVVTMALQLQVSHWDCSLKILNPQRYAWKGFQCHHNTNVSHWVCCF